MFQICWPQYRLVCPQTFNLICVNSLCWPPIVSVFSQPCHACLFKQAKVTAGSIPAVCVVHALKMGWEIEFQSLELIFECKWETSKRRVSVLWIRPSGCQIKWHWALQFTSEVVYICISADVNYLSPHACDVLDNESLECICWTKRV